MRENDPLRGYRFRLEIDAIEQAAFGECTGVDISTDPIDYRVGDEASHGRTLPGLTKFGNVTLKAGITRSMALYRWHKDVVEGTVERKTVAIVVLDETGDEQARYEIVDAWPCKYDPMDLNATGNDVAIETLELSNEGVTRIA